MALNRIIQRLTLGPRTLNLTQGRLRDNIWQLSWPMMISQALSFLPGLLDAYWLGTLGPHGLAAASLAMSLRITMISLLMALSGASGAVIARFVGARDGEQANLAATQAILLFAVAAGVLGVIGLLFTIPLLKLVGASGDLLAPTAAYAQAIFGGLIAMEMVPSVSNMLNSSGSPQLSLRMNLLTLCAFAALEPLLLGLGLGVGGAGIALALANTAGMIYGLHLLASGMAGVRIERRFLRPDWPMIGRILRIALPGVIQRGGPNLANTILLRILSGYGAAPLAAFSLIGRLTMLLLVPSSGLVAAAPAMVGQNLGARQAERAKQAVRRIAAGVASMAVVLLGLLVVFVRPALSIFTHDPAVIAVAVAAIGLLSLYRLLFHLSSVMEGALVGAGDTLSPMLINTVAQWGIQLPAVWFLSTQRGLDATGVWWGLVFGMAAQAALMTGRFWQGRWQRVQI